MDPNDPDASGPKEFRKIRDMLANGDTVKSDDFSAYGNRAVREALREMFHGKCAYCESKIAGSQDTDVEHYRPKKGVTEAEEAGVAHPGYWWLAMVWENLVLSCQHCNQSRSYHVVIPDDLETEDELIEFLQNQRTSGAGKQNAFPTEDSAWALGPEDDLTVEKPLILNPVDTDPDNHLDWVLFRGASTVRAHNGSPVGEATLKILGLNRRWLEEDRRRHLLEMREDRNDIIYAINNWLMADDQNQKDDWKIQADRSIDRLVRRTAAEKPFAGMARAFLALVQEEVIGMQHR
ncbi:MAG: HNH endonuclease [Hoeflea sp.]|uniref:HNH endonuclease n=1 Tax=Hoeflea sp. TaxID=1940281 RepID=UPI0032EF65BE